MTRDAAVQVDRRFARSARVDADMGKPDAIKGYVLQPSVSQAYSTMADAVAQRRQGAFSWTGPYGGGKSSAALVLGAALGPVGSARKAADALLGAQTRKLLETGFHRSRAGWRVVALSGRRADIGDDLRRHLSIEKEADLVWSIRSLANDPVCDGVLIVVDELGKYLEHAAQDGGDLHILQDLAELSARSDGRLVLLGILHQSFERYASKLPRATRDEWAKIQGRFQDIPLATAGDETLELISRAITAVSRPAVANALAARVSSEVRRRRGSAPVALEQMLAGCWPLHPVVALLLGPMARHRFGQNERSVFSFLGSTEPAGFQEFLAAGVPGPYTPARLFDYLVANLSPSILASSEGHKFSTSLDAVDRAAARGGPLHIALAKTVTLIELFGAGTGLIATLAILAAAVEEASERAIGEALNELVEWSVLVHRKHLGGYAVFAGSDFDLDAAVAAATSGENVDLTDRLALPPVVAKRHYHRTGCLRWSEVLVYSLPMFENGPDSTDPARFTVAHQAAFDSWRSNRRSTAAIVLAVRPSKMEDRDAEAAAKAIARRADDTCVACGLPRSSYLIRELAIELDSLERVAQQNPQLEGDQIARREVRARMAEVASRLEQEIRRAFDSAKWFAAGRRAASYDGRALSAIASAEADQLFVASPLIRNELINRDKPSSNAMAAVRALLHAMASAGSSARLGLVAYPPEFALYASVLRESGLHSQQLDGTWSFGAPDDGEIGASYAAVWSAASALPDGSKIADLYAVWRQAPIGLRAGPMPILAFAWLLANAKTTAVYLDGLFTPVIDELLADRLLQSPDAIALRHVALGREQDALLHGLADRLAGRGFSDPATPLTISKMLVRVALELPAWSQRSRSFSPEARRIRDLLMHASDPNKLLFDEIAHLRDTPGQCVEAVEQALCELEEGYPAMLEQLAGALAQMLGCDPATFDGIGRRVVTAIGMSGDLRLDAFAQRTAALERASNRRGAIEGLASFLVHKPANQWADQDVDKAHAELVRFARGLREAEAVAVARGRASGAEALSIVRASRGGEPHVHTFEVSADEAETANAIADVLVAALRQGSARVQLAAVVEALRRIEAAEQCETAA
ncbi:hypothetical protein SAMN03159463_02336 [Mesorhizobium sp. NFR06]|uniref:hypothetical protein n=1 Tax=Mesorhizobium sp. NFR06 TaxID=1566290 RepID=UPI0008E74C32|nr:hypothetical protein [Mesorhizobium sp. NFR06]SFO57834.1 hypothetical protein SAMN03159463_02336 [Mesorhizobium sp. NFR06]